MFKIDKAKFKRWWCTKKSINLYRILSVIYFVSFKIQGVSLQSKHNYYIAEDTIGVIYFFSFKTQQVAPRSKHKRTVQYTVKKICHWNIQNKLWLQKISSMSSLKILVPFFREFYLTLS